MNRAISIGLPGEEILQRYLARRIFRETEFSVKEVDGTITVGFVTGFDERVLQLSTSPLREDDEPHSVLIFWPVSRIEETGRRLDDFDQEHRNKIRSYSSALRSQCESVLANRGPSRNQDLSGR